MWKNLFILTFALKLNYAKKADSRGCTKYIVVNPSNPKTSYCREFLHIVTLAEKSPRSHDLVNILKSHLPSSVEENYFLSSPSSEGQVFVPTTSNSNMFIEEPSLTNLDFPQTTQDIPTASIQSYTSPSEMPWTTPTSAPCRITPIVIPIPLNIPKTVTVGGPNCASQDTYGVSTSGPPSEIPKNTTSRDWEVLGTDAWIVPTGISSAGSTTPPAFGQTANTDILTTRPNNVFDLTPELRMSTLQLQSRTTLGVSSPLQGSSSTPTMGSSFSLTTHSGGFFNVTPGLRISTDSIPSYPIFVQNATGMGFPNSQGSFPTLTPTSAPTPTGPDQHFGTEASPSIITSNAYTAGEQSAYGCPSAAPSIITQFVTVTQAGRVTPSWVLPMVPIPTINRRQKISKMIKTNTKLKFISKPTRRGCVASPKCGFICPEMMSDPRFKNDILPMRNFCK